MSKTPSIAERLDAFAASVPAGARMLDLGNCGLTEVPAAVFDLADRLETLDLSGNRLTSLPPAMGRLKNLRRLFCSKNPFEMLPPVLGECAALSQVGFRGCGLREVPAESLPSNIRWLILTDNRLERLPDALGARPALQKLMLAGNRLRALPPMLAGAQNLELLRIAANAFEALPSWLADMPALAWLAFAGNPFEMRGAAAPVEAVRWGDLRLGALLGQGASGHVHAAAWSRGGGAPREVAVKLYKGVMTSDGLTESERAACLAAGPHPHLVAGLGFLRDHPDGTDGLLMPLLKRDWRVLAGPPSAESCSRDVYAEDFRLPVEVALRIARGTAAAAAHLHASGLMHGDLYAHNVLWDGTTGAARLSDFGAASFLASDAAGRCTRLEVRAWAILLGELLDRCETPPPESLRDLQRRCAGLPSSRPTMADALDVLSRAV